MEFDLTSVLGDGAHFPASPEAAVADVEPAAGAKTSLDLSVSGRVASMHLEHTRGQRSPAPRVISRERRAALIDLPPPFAQDPTPPPSTGELELGDRRVKNARRGESVPSEEEERTITTSRFNAIEPQRAGFLYYLTMILFALSLGAAGWLVRRIWF